MRSVMALIGFVGVCFVAAAVGGLFTARSVGDWYASLTKPSFTPPDWVFGPVWSVLYAMMGAAAWGVWRKAGFGGARWAMTLFAGQLALNVAWSGLFFGLRRPGLAMIDIALLAAAITATVILFARHSAIGAALMVPYLLWVGFASVLNAAIWQLNR